jgi:hypothetical protein
MRLLLYSNNLAEIFISTGLVEFRNEFCFALGAETANLYQGAEKSI